MKFIAYYRVSDKHGLALNSLRSSVERHVTQEGGKLIREFIETVTDFGQIGEVFEAAVRQCRSDKGGCTEFCVNGQSTAGASRPVRKHNEHQETRRTRRTAVWPAGQLQEA